MFLCRQVKIIDFILTVVPCIRQVRHFNFKMCIKGLDFGEIGFDGVWCDLAFKKKTSIIHQALLNSPVL